MNLKHMTLLALLLFSAACSLSAREEALEAGALATATEARLNAADINATATSIALARQPATSAPPLTTQPQTSADTTSGGSASQTSGSSTTTSAQPRFRSGCTPRADWPLYTVVSGDTLASIARRANSTVAQLADANCLADVNLLSTGQQLRVPQAPAQAGNGSTFNGATTIGDVKIEPVLRFENGVAVLNAGQPLVVSWSGAPVNNLIQVEFTLLPDSNPNAPINLGIDTNLSDGVFVYWTPPQNVSGRIFAGGRRPGQTHEILVSTVLRVSTGQGSVGQVIVNPYERVDANGLVLVRPGTKVTLTWPLLPASGVQRVEFYYFRPSAAGTPGILGTDTNPADGVAFAWTVPADISGELTAIAYLNGGALIRTAKGTPISAVLPAENTRVGAVKVTNGQARSDGWVQLAAGATAQLSWPEAPTNASRVEFYSAPTGTGVSATLIGTDSNLADGATTSWQAPAGFTGHLSAKAFLGDGTTRETNSFTAVMVETTALPPNGRLTIAPNIGFDGATYTLDRNAVVTVSLVEADLADVSYVDFYYFVQVPGIDPQTVHIGRDGNVGDGAQVSWHIPGGVEGYIYAVAGLVDGRSRESDTVRVYAEIIR